MIWLAPLFTFLGTARDWTWCLTQWWQVVCWAISLAQFLNSSSLLNHSLSPLPSSRQLCISQDLFTSFAWNSIFLLPVASFYYIFFVYLVGCLFSIANWFLFFVLEPHQQYSQLLLLTQELLLAVFRGMLGTKPNQVCARKAPYLMLYYHSGPME